MEYYPLIYPKLLRTDDHSIESPNLISNLLGYWAGFPNWMLLKLHSFCGFFIWHEGQKVEKDFIRITFQQTISGNANKKYFWKYGVMVVLQYIELMCSKKCFLKILVVYWPEELWIEYWFPRYWISRSNNKFDSGLNTGKAFITYRLYWSSL